MEFTDRSTIIGFGKYVLCRNAWTLTLFIALIGALSLLNPGSIDRCKNIIPEGT